MRYEWEWRQLLRKKLIDPGLKAVSELNGSEELLWWRWIASRPTITWLTVQRIPLWDFKELSYNPNIGWNIAIRYPLRFWDWRALSCKNDVTWRIVKDNPHLPWCWWGLSSNPNITWDIVLANPDCPWDDEGLSWNPSISWDTVLCNPQRKWNWSARSAHPDTTWGIVQANPDKQWDWAVLSAHPNITWEIVQSNSDKPWNYWNMAVQNPNITWDIVETDYQTGSGKLWQWYMCNPNVTMEMLTQHPEIPRDIYGISRNPNLTFEFIEKYPSRALAYRYALQNSMPLERKLFIENRAARVIQNWWLEIRLNPYHPVGLKKLERDYAFYADGKGARELGAPASQLAHH